jgi:GxxExxY protein
MEPYANIASLDAEATRINALSRKIIGAALRIQVRLGPGLLENAYLACLEYELKKVGVSVQSQVALPLRYETVTLEVGYRIDLLVDDLVIVELKACESILPVHRAQLLSYLRLSEKRLGLLINFHAYPLKSGIARIVNRL